MEKQIKSNGKSLKSGIRIKNKSQQVIDESEIKQQMENHVKALCDMDLDGTMTIYDPGILSFDVEGTYLGTEAKRKAWTNVFFVMEPSLNYEIRDLTITVGGDVAFLGYLYYDQTA
jgi:ketosteroid isomerase-like protein